MSFHLSVPAIVAMVAFAGVSIFIGSFMAGAGGWRAAAGRFPARNPAPPATARFRFVSLRMSGGVLGTAAYQNVVILELSDRGIGLSLLTPFRLFHPPMLIPWNAIESCEQHFTPWGDAARVTLHGGGGFSVAGAAAKALLERRPGGAMD